MVLKTRFVNNWKGVEAGVRMLCSRIAYARLDHLQHELLSTGQRSSGVESRHSYVFVSVRPAFEEITSERGLGLIQRHPAGPTATLSLDWVMPRLDAPERFLLTRVSRL